MGEAASEFWRMHAFWRTTGRSAAGLWVSVGLAFVGTVLVARGLGPAGFGAFALATAVVATATALLDVPLEEAVVHFGARAKGGGADATLRRLIWQGLLGDLLVGAVVFVLLASLAGPVARLASGGWLEPNLVVLAALAGFVRTCDGTTGAVLLLAGRPDLRAWSMAAANGLRLILVGGSSLLLGSVHWALVAALVAAAAASTFQAMFAWRAGWTRWRGATEGPDLEVGMMTLLGFGAKSGIAATISGARNGIIPVLLGRLSGPEAVAIFNVATFPLQAAGVADAPLRLVLLPEHARLAAEGRSGEIAGSIRAYARGALAVGIPAAIAGWFLLPWLIPVLYSARYAAAVTPSRVLVLAALIGLIMGWSKSLPGAMGRPGLRVAVLAGDAAVALAVLALTANRGPLGAALAVLAGMVTQAGMWWRIAPRAIRAVGTVSPPLPARTRAEEGVNGFPCVSSTSRR